MSDPLSVSAIVRAVAEKASRRVTRKVIADFQRLGPTLSGDDSGLTTVWDEICVQVQHEESCDWDTYDEAVQDLVRCYVDDLPQHEREAIWLQTEVGIDWDWEEPEDREASPVCSDDITEYLVNKYVYAEADRWSNPRIRAYVDRANMRD